MKTLVSTKTFAVMCLLAGQIMTVRLEEGFTRQCSTLRCFVVSLLHHSLLQYFREETRDACIAAGRLDPRPSSDLFFKGDCDISETGLHDTVLVLHELRVNR